VLVRQKSKKLQQLILMYQIQNILILTSPNCNNLYVYLDQNLTFRLGVILHFCYLTLFITIICPSTHHSLPSQLTDSSDPLTTFTTKIPPLNNYLFCFFPYTQWNKPIVKQNLPLVDYNRFLTQNYNMWLIHFNIFYSVKKNILVLYNIF
jgi:hypothetical protein